MSIQWKSTLACPECGSKITDRMPEDSCRYFRECPSCGELMKAKKGDCCVYCSYGDIPCPPVQKEGACC